MGGSDDDGKVTRRDWLKTVGAVAGGTALLGPLAACDEGATPQGDADATAGPDASGPDALADVAMQPDASGPDIQVDSADVPPARPGLTPLRGDGSHPFHYIDTLVIVQMENRSFDHFLGSLSLVDGRADVDGLTAAMTNPGLDGTLVAPRKLGSEHVISPDPSHSHTRALDQWNGGKNDGFVKAWEPLLSPAEFALKRDYIMGYHTRETLPVTYALADAFTVCDRWFCSLLGPTWPNRFYSHAATSDGQWGNKEFLTAPTLYPLLEEAGYTYGCFHANLLYFMFTIASLSVDDHHAEPLDLFFENAAAGTLPNVCILDPAFGAGSDHPPEDTRQGQIFIGSVYEALRQSPQWERSMMVLLYDENGGFYDHVAPPKAAGDERAAEGFDQLGFRIPGLVIGPLAGRGQAFHGVVDHSSIPSLISNVFGLPHLNERSRLAGDLGGALSLDLRFDDVRPVPPRVPPVDLSMEQFERSLGLPSGQPELEVAAATRGWRRDLRVERRMAERALWHSERLGAVRIR
ncbi:MAG: phosphoesterase [Deltaproteobacteria bacterium]|nr:phosphoesterase [Deltaproteobacteria bacterium]MCB9787063.1 phosphoesterase [Deltaproteobacteria bacterium]